MKFLFRYLYNKSIKSLWIICCLGLGLMPVLIGLCIYAMNLKSFHQQTVRNNEAMLMQMYDLTEKAFNDISNTAYEISTSDYPGLYESVYSTSRETAVKMQIQNGLAASRDRSLYISEIGIFFPDMDEVITDSTTAPLDIIYYNDYRHTYSDSDALRKRILSVGSADLLLIEGENEQRSLLYVRRVDVSRENSPFVLIRLDNTILSGMIENVERYTFCELNFLLYGSDQYYYPVSSQMQRFMDHNADINPSAVLKRDTINGNDAVSYISSQYLDLTMVLYTPRKMSGYEITRINLYFLIGLLILLLGSTGLTIFFIRTNYKPVRELLDLASDAGYLARTDLGKISTNEFTVLKEVLSFSKSQNRYMEEMMETQQGHLRNSLLVLLMQNSKMVLKKPEYLGILKDSFPFDFFCVSAIRVCVNDTEEKRKGYLEKSMEASETDVRCFLMIKETDCVILLFNMNERERGETDILKIIAGFIEEIDKEIQKPEERAVYAVSSVHEGIAEISDAYQEADYALRYRLIFGDDLQNDGSQEVAPFSLSKSFYYVDDDEKRLMNAIVDGRADLAENTFREIWQRNTVEHKIPSEYIYFLLSDIVSTIIRAGNMVPLGKDISDYILKSSREMMEEESIEKLQHEVLLLIHEVSNAYEREHSRSSERLKQRIYEYIEKNYSDPNLNVEAISDEFGRSRTSLFTIFKDGTGNSLLYHINKIRIQHAQELLEKTDKPVGVIAEETGFTSAVNFTRVFKKYMMVTPGKYRELHAKGRE